MQLLVDQLAQKAACEGKAFVAANGTPGGMKPAAATASKATALMGVDHLSATRVEALAQVGSAALGTLHPDRHQGASLDIGPVTVELQPCQRSRRKAALNRGNCFLG